MQARQILLAGAVLGGLGVAFGAFGAHWLENSVQHWGLASEEQLRRLASWEVAVRYQMYHALALLVVGLLASRSKNRWLGWSAGFLIVGVAIFSGCLYTLVLSGVKVLGAVVPIGGSCMIVGWILLAIAAQKTPD